MVFLIGMLAYFVTFQMVQLGIKLLGLPRQPSSIPPTPL